MQASRHKGKVNLHQLATHFGGFCLRALLLMPPCAAQAALYAPVATNAELIEEADFMLAELERKRRAAAAPHLQPA